MGGAAPLVRRQLRQPQGRVGSSVGGTTLVLATADTSQAPQQRQQRRRQQLQDLTMENLVPTSATSSRRHTRPIAHVDHGQVEAPHLHLHLHLRLQSTTSANPTQELAAIDRLATTPKSRCRPHFCGMSGNMPRLHRLSCSRNPTNMIPRRAHDMLPTTEARSQDREIPPAWIPRPSHVTKEHHPNFIDLIGVSTK